MTHRPRQRSSSEVEVGSSGCGSSAPPSETSDQGSEMGDSGVVANQNPNNLHHLHHHISAKVVINHAAAAGGGGGAGMGMDDEMVASNGITVNGFYVNGGGIVGGGSTNTTDSDVHSSSATSMTNEDSLSDSGILMECERGQVESFFSGLGTEIFVSSSLANLYENVGANEWRLVYTGVPVLVHDKGSAKSRNTPRVTFVLAERGSCFALWRDTIDNLSDYKVAGPAFHTMCLSSDHRKVIGFSFDSNTAAREVWHCIERLTSDPENIALSLPGRKKRKQQKQQRHKYVQLPPKSQISHPCQFNHITSVTQEDTPRYFSLQAFVAAPVQHREH